MLRITIPGRAPSLNHAKRPCRVGGKLRLVPSREGRAASREIEMALIPHRSELRAFAASVNRKTHGIGMEYVFGYLQEQLATQKGELSLGLPDIDNCFKAIKDQIFKVMGLNDGLVVHLVGSKRVRPRVEIYIKMYLVPLTQLDFTEGVEDGKEEAGP
jgi:hypothetical protein